MWSPPGVHLESTWSPSGVHQDCIWSLPGVQTQYQEFTWTPDGVHQDPWGSVTYSIFSRTDTTTDSERFYSSILDVFKDVEEIQEVNDLQRWWNQCVIHYSFSAWLTKPIGSQIFPNYSTARRPLCKNSALARIKAKRSELRATISSHDGEHV